MLKSICLLCMLAIWFLFYKFGFDIIKLTSHTDKTNVGILPCFLPCWIFLDTNFACSNVYKFYTIFFNLETKVKFNFGYYAFYSYQVMPLLTLAVT